MRANPQDPSWRSSSKKQQLPLPEHARVWRLDWLDGCELFEARYLRHTFTRHAHSALAIGVVDSGPGAFRYHGATHGTSRDTLVLIGPEEPHTGGVARPVAEGETPLVYRMFYFEPLLITQLCGDSALSRARFDEPAPHDPDIAAQLRRLHTMLRDDGRSLIERETQLSDTLYAVVARYGAGRGHGEADRTREPRAIALAREYLESHLRETVSLRELANLVKLHPAYLNRAFRSTVGMPPHAWHTNRRLERARALLASGESPTAVAWATGFADQSHLTRHFRRTFGLPPGRYRAMTSGRV